MGRISAALRSDGAGTRLAAPLSRAQTWSIETRGKTRVVVEFDYVANVLALNQAKITGTFAFFTGTQLFLEPVGHRNASSLVRFVVPPGWRIVSALLETSDPTVYTAPDYDTLVDAPTWLGAFELQRFDVDGKPHLLVLGSGARFAADSMRRHTERLATMVRTAGAIFGGLPYDKYGVGLGRHYRLLRAPHRVSRGVPVRHGVRDDSGIDDRGERAHRGATIRVAERCVDGDVATLPA